MITSTEVINGKTIRTWEEPRSNGKTLTRKFYIRYRVNAICNGKHYTIAMCDTQSAAEQAMFDTKAKVDNKYKPKMWLNMSDRTPLTHIYEVGFLSTSGAKKSISLYLTAEGGERISETLN